MLIFIGNEILFTSWGNNQPDNGDDSCLIMRRSLINYDWDDVRCQDRFPYACQLGKLTVRYRPVKCSLYHNRSHKILTF